MDRDGFEMGNSENAKKFGEHKLELKRMFLKNRKLKFENLEGPKMNSVNSID